ncbi:MAG: hypothetical protein Q8Q28_14960 [Pseudomonadota bacterium]|nr:hypothetical protein [Pseudomonadota bacterium]
MLGTRSDAQPTSLPVVGLGDNRISTDQTMPITRPAHGMDFAVDVFVTR